jgi:cation transport regulator ChaB
MRPTFGQVRGGVELRVGRRREEAAVPRDAKEDLPGTIQRSPAKAQRTYAKTLESAHREYDDEERAHRTAYAALKHSFEKVGDHWEPKDHKGPSDPQAKGGRDTHRETAGGVDVEGHSKKELYERAARLRIRNRSKMSKMELAKAIARKQD